MKRISTFYKITFLFLLTCGCFTSSSVSGQQKPISKQQPFICGTPDTDISPEILAMMQRSKHMANARIKDDTRYAYRISVDIDSDTYFEYGGDTVKIKRDVLQSMAVVSRIFENEVNIKVTVVNIHIQKNSQTDPYFGEDDIFKLLRVVVDRHQRTSDFARPYDALIYAPTKDVNGAGGVSAGRGRNVSPLGRISTTAHEIGHDLGSAHTHNCGWEGGPLDYIYPVEGDCYTDAVELKVGTIMSYSGIENYKFHPQVRGLFRAFADRNLLKVTSPPANVILSETYNNPANKPYLAFTPDPKADEFIVQTANSVAFDDILSSDTTDIPLMHLSDITDNASLYVRVKALNSFGESDWSNVSEVRNGNGLKTPLPAENSHLAVMNVDRSIELKFSEVENATFYEVVLDPFHFNYVQTNSADTFQVTTPMYFLRNYPYVGNPIRWRVRAVNATEKSAWSDFQTILQNMNTEFYRYVNYSDINSLPVQFTIGNDNTMSFQTSQFTVRNAETSEVIDTYNSDLSEFSPSLFPLFQPNGLKPNNTYELTMKTTNVLPDYQYNIPAGLSQTVTTQFSTEEKENLELLTYFGSRTGNDVGRNIKALAFTEEYAFIENEEGISRLEITGNSSSTFNRTNTNGKISNRSGFTGTDASGNLWMLTQLSKRVQYNGSFPLDEHELRMFDPKTMQQVKKYEIPYTGRINYFDVESMVINTFQDQTHSIFTVSENGLDLLGKFSDNRLLRHQLIKITPQFYWLESTSRGYLEIARVKRNDKSVVLFSRITSEQLPSNFSYIVNKKEELVISANNQGFENELLVFNADPGSTPTSLPLPNDKHEIEALALGINDMLYVLSINENNGFLHRYYQGQWINEIALPSGFDIGRRYSNVSQLFEIDKEGNVWLSASEQLNKITICDKAAAPNLTFEGGGQADSLTLFAEGCTNATWKLTSEHNGFTQFFSDDNSLKIKNEESTIKVSCVQNGCVSNQSTATIGGAATVSLTEASKQEACPGDSLDISVALKGLFGKENVINSSLIFNGQTYKTGMSSGSSTIRVKIPESLSTAGKAILRVTTSSPEVTSNDFELTILPRPSVNIISNDLMCENDELLLRAASTDTTVRFGWFANSSDSLLKSTDSLRIQSPGTFRLTGKDAKGCTNEVSKTIAYYPVKPKVTITGIEVLCKDATLTLLSAATGVAPFTFDWKQEVQQLTTTDSLLTIKNPGVYTVTAKDKNGCLTDVASFTVKPSTLPDAAITGGNNTNLIPTDGMEIHVTSAPNRSYLWYKNDQPLTNETNNTLTVKQAGSYKVQLTEADCQFTTQPLNLMLVLAAEEIVVEKTLLLYPNPTAGQLTIEFDKKRNQKPGTIYFYSSAGSLVKTYQHGTGNKLLIDVSPLPAGTYFLKSEAGTQQVLLGKFVKK